MTRIKVCPSDSIYVKEYKEFRYFNTDTLFQHLATRGYGAAENEMYYYYYDIVYYMSGKQRKKKSGNCAALLAATTVRMWLSRLNSFPCL